MLSIPSRALIFDHSQYYVLVYKSPSDITIRPVQVLNTVGDRAYISEGLTEGEHLIGTQALTHLPGTEQLDKIRTDEQDPQEYSGFFPEK